MALAELVQKAGDGDFLRTIAEAVLQLLMEADVEGMIGAGRLEPDGMDGSRPPPRALRAASLATE